MLFYKAPVVDKNTPKTLSNQRAPIVDQNEIKNKLYIRGDSVGTGVLVLSPFFASFLTLIPIQDPIRNMVAERSFGKMAVTNFSSSATLNISVIAAQTYKWEKQQVDTRMDLPDTVIKIIKRKRKQLVAFLEWSKISELSQSREKVGNRQTNERTDGQTQVN